MCGIAGIHSLSDDLTPPRLTSLRAMAASLRHRGPDEFGVFRDRHTGLAHARLSVIDLSTGQQPMSNEQGTLWTVYNGEIFNYVELRSELRARGHRFRTTSDTEVVVHAYEEWGDEAFDRFNGQWAVALWDARRRRLILSRDRFGIHPLYACEHDGRLYFASEVKAIFAADASIPRAFDPAGFEETFTFWTVVPPQSVFRGIEEIRPGLTRTFQGGRIGETRCSALRYTSVGAASAGGPEFRGSAADAAQAVRHALTEATRLRMLRADVAVGSYLSGGLDSSLVAALARQVSPRTLCTFSIRFEDAEYDESCFQRAMSLELGSDHREVVVSRQDITACFPEVVAHCERPILRTAPAPLFLLSRLVRDAGIKVVLTGEGADEMFAGYDLFREARIRRFSARQPESAWRSQLLQRLYPYMARSPVAQSGFTRQFFGNHSDHWREPGFGHSLRWQTTRALRRLFHPEFRTAAASTDVIDRLLRDLPAEFGRWPYLTQDQHLEIRTLLSGYLLSSQGDRMLTAHSVEGRFPFLDANVAALADSLPPDYKLRGLDEKRVLKRAADGLVPSAILARRKQPYRAPDALSFVDGAPDWVAEVLSPRAVEHAGVFSPGAVTQLWAKLQNRRNAGQFSNADNMGFVGVLSTQLLHRQLVARRPQFSSVVRWTTIIDRVATTQETAPV